MYVRQIKTHKARRKLTRSAKKKVKHEISENPMDSVPISTEQWQAKISIRISHFRINIQSGFHTHIVKRARKQTNYAIESAFKRCSALWRKLSWNFQILLAKVSDLLRKHRAQHAAPTLRVNPAHHPHTRYTPHPHRQTTHRIPKSPAVTPP